MTAGVFDAVGGESRLLTFILTRPAGEAPQSVQWRFRSLCSFPGLAVSLRHLKLSILAPKLCAAR